MILTILGSLSLVLIFLIFIVASKKLLKDRINKSNEKKVILIGILIWTSFYTIYYLIFYSFYLANLNIALRLSIITSILIRSLFTGLLSGWLIILLLLKKIKRPLFIGAVIGFLIYLLGGFIPGYWFITSWLYNLLRINILYAGIWEIICSFIVVPLIFILIGIFIGLIVKLRRKKIIWVSLILMIIFSSLFFVFKKPDIEISHTIPRQIVNPIEATDRITVKYNIIYELKPNNPRAIARGEKQLQEYTDLAKEAFPGRDWTGEIITYG